MLRLTLLCSWLCVSPLVAVNRIVPEEYTTVIVDDSLRGAKSRSRAELAKSLQVGPPSDWFYHAIHFRMLHFQIYT